MKTPIDARFRHEAEAFQLRFGCEDCVHFALERRACANGYPTQPHLGVRLEERAELEFCKEFELA